MFLLSTRVTSSVVFRRFRYSRLSTGKTFFVWFKKMSASERNISDKFLEAMQHVPWSVVVVTTSNGVIKRGMTCSSFTSVSKTPPIVSFCIMQPSRMDALLSESGKFAINVLSDEQVNHSMHFAKVVGDHEDQFEGITHSLSEMGCPVLHNCCAVLHCNVHSHHTVGDHHVWYGGVVNVSHSNRTPLLYYARSYRPVGDESFMQSFETTNLAYEDWTHEAHLRMSWNYLMEFGKEKATPLIKEGIKKYNKRHSEKIKRGYHETVTCFFIHMISVAIGNSMDANSFEEFLEQNSHLTKSDMLYKYYSKETINSEEARNRFVSPDIHNLPSDN